MRRPPNTFADGSDTYASARPHYPPALFAWLAGECRQRDRAWDCATGSGQAAVGLSSYFQSVHATDISAEQLMHASHRDNIHYSIGSAEAVGFRNECFDLIVVAQALHWFEYVRFWPEVLRLARQDALFCAWGYDWLQSTPEVDANLVEPVKRILAPFWAPNNKILWDGYRNEDIAFPWRRIETPRLAVAVEWTLAQLVAYMMTWSAFKRSRSDARAAASMDRLIARSRFLVPAEVTLSIRMPLKMVAGRVR